MKQALLNEIDRLIRVVRKNQGKWNVFVCNESENGPYEREIKRMVRRHIGSSTTINSFLRDRGVEGVTGGKANAYRILMLENMKKMVEKEYK